MLLAPCRDESTVSTLEVLPREDVAVVTRVLASPGQRLPLVALCLDSAVPIVRVQPRQICSLLIQEVTRLSGAASMGRAEVAQRPVASRATRTQAATNMGCSEEEHGYGALDVPQ